MGKPSKAILAAIEATVAQRRKPGQSCRTCALTTDVRDALAYARNERGFTYSDCSKLLRQLGHNIAPSVVRMHIVSGHGNP
jgi:hypothetical protein